MTKPYVISFANQKGGVGKTTSCVNIASCAAAMGQRVLLIDEEVPTFDEGDRMYDSDKRLLFVTDGRDICLIEVHYGYELGSFTLYKRMTEAKAAIKPLLDRAGLPTDQIRFEA